jgi:hypothetical protein
MLGYLAERGDVDELERQSLSSRIKCGAYRAAMSRNGAPMSLLKSLLPLRNWD